MDGVHDVGGLEGFGPVDAPPSEPVFAEEWERGAFRVAMAALGGLQSPGGRFRHSIERMDPAHYLASSYYEHWNRPRVPVCKRRLALVAREPCRPR